MENIRKNKILFFVEWTHLLVIFLIKLTFLYILIFKVESNIPSFDPKKSKNLENVSSYFANLRQNYLHQNALFRTRNSGRTLNYPTQISIITILMWMFCNEYKLKIIN